MSGRAAACDALAVQIEEAVPAPLSLTLFVRTDGPDSDRAREAVAAMLPRLAEEVQVAVKDMGEFDARRLGISVAPVLHVQRGGQTVGWVARFDSHFLADRLRALGVPLR